MRTRAAKKIQMLYRGWKAKGGKAPAGKKGKGGKKKK